MNKHTAPSLLPIGIRDLLPPESWLYHDMCDMMLGLFKQYGYDLVIPPLLEFQQHHHNELPQFYVMDPQTQALMSLRSDMTLPIARIAEHRLKDRQRPLRLSYAGDVCRVKGDMIRPDRQFQQIGIELVGAQKIDHDIEVMAIAIHALESLNIGNITLDLTIPTFFDHICHAYDISDNTRDELLSFIALRDDHGVAKIGNNDNEKQASELLARMMALSGAPTNLENANLDKLPINVKKLCENLILVYHELQQIYPKLHISFDLFEYEGFSYQSGLSFTIFSKDTKGELGRGGQYPISQDNISEYAIGFSLYSDILLRVASLNHHDYKTKKIDDDTPFKDIKQYVEHHYYIKR